MATPAEQEAFVWMQGRMVELLMRHDVVRLSATFGERQSALFDDTQHTLLHPYRELAVLFYLRDELFGSILPRIKRRLSFLAPREIVEEQLPPRGRVDWPRTMAASLRDRPGEPPLDVQTRQRRRHFATPENLLTVTTLLEYRSIVQRRLDDEADRGAHAMRHPLREIVESCERELAFPQFTGLVRQCEHIADGYGEQTSADLEQIVGEHLIPGRNSAYDDLITWRRQLIALRLLDRDHVPQSSAMLGSNPAEDNYLYQCWIFYEIGALLEQRRQLLSWDIATMSLTYCWGSDSAQACYRLQHDQAILYKPDSVWLQAPGVRPDLYIRRVDGEEIRDRSTLIWRERGYVLDAKYYKPRGSVKAPANPVKRMLADLQLTGEQHGALLFAFQSGEASPARGTDEFEPERESGAHSDGLLYSVIPDSRATHATITMDIDVWRLRPQLTGGTSASEQILSALLEKAHRTLVAPIPIACHGFLPDVDTINPSGTPPMRCPTCGDVLAFCPKPHVHAQRIDRVCPRCDCLRTKRLCHIKDRGTYTAPPFIRRVLTREDLFANIATLRTWLRESVSAEAEDPAAEEARGRLLQTIGELTETYVKLTRADTTQTEYTLREWVFGAHWSESNDPRGLPSLVRQMLISGEFVWLQFQGSSVEDWAACAVQYTRALEHEIHRRIYEPCGERLVTREGLPMTSRQFTIGTVLFLYSQRKVNLNWQCVLEHVAQPSGIDEATMKQLVLDIDALRLDRNKVAHTEHVNEALARKIRERVLGQQGQPGLLFRLITQLKPPAA